MNKYLCPSGLSAVSAKVLLQYVYVNETLPWTEARTYCRQNYRDLAPVTSSSINSRIQHLIHGVEQPVWIGLHDNMRTWVWSFRSQRHENKLNYKNWRHDEPDNMRASENCTAITMYGYWVDTPCMKQYSVVCFQGKKVFFLTAFQ